MAEAPAPRSPLAGLADALAEAGSDSVALADQPSRTRLNLRLHVHWVEVRQVNNRHADVQCDWRRLRDCDLGQICNRVNLRDDNLRDVHEVRAVRRRTAVD